MENTATRLLSQANQYAAEYIESLNKRSVFPTPESIAAMEVFDEPIPEHSTTEEEVLQLLHTQGSPATVAQIGGRYFGFVNGGVQPVALAARWLSDVWDQNAALYVMSPIASKLEQICQRWLVSLFQLPGNTVAGFVSGTSAANICGIAAARNALLRRLHWDVNQRGLRGAPQIRIIVSEQAHGTVMKGLALLGLGARQVQQIACDDQGRMKTAQLPELDRTTLVVTGAGNVNSGAFDPIGEICRRARAVGAWVHVDGAFGLWAAASGNTRHLCEGIELADSWSVDAHKTLNAPYDCGVVFCRHREALISALQAGGDYIQWSGERDGMRYTPEMSRRARAVELWAILKVLGRPGVESLIGRLCKNARLFSKLLRQADFQVLNDVVFNQVLVACDSDQQTRSTLNTIQNSGVCWCSGSMWRGKPVIRISVCSAATTERDVRESVSAFVQARNLHVNR